LNILPEKIETLENKKDNQIKKIEGYSLDFRRKPSMKPNNIAKRPFNIPKPQTQEESISINRVVPPVSPISTPAPISGYAKPTSAPTFGLMKSDYTVPIAEITSQKELEETSNFTKFQSEEKAPENDFAIASGSKLGIKWKDGQNRFERFMNVLNQDYEDIDEGINFQKSTNKNQESEEEKKDIKMEVDLPEEDQESQKQRSIHHIQEKEIRLDPKTTDKEENDHFDNLNSIKKDAPWSLEAHQAETKEISINEDSPFEGEYQKAIQKWDNPFSLPVTFDPSLLSDPSKKIFSLQTHVLPTSSTPLSIFSEIEKLRSKESPMGKYKLLAKKMTGELSQYKLKKLQWICTREGTYKNLANVDVLCQFWRNWGELSSPDIYTIMKEMLMRDGKKVPSEFWEEWVNHHFRFTLWKMRAFERGCKESTDLTNLENVIHDLMKKFDDEFGKGKRSFFQRIVDGDEQASRRAVLLVADIKEVAKDEKCLVELYDGRYSLFSVIRNKAINSLEDELQIFQMIQDGKIFIGQKLHVSGGCLLTNGVDSWLEEFKQEDCPHYFLSRQGTSNLVLNYNGISRAQVNETLGYHKDRFLTKWLKEINQNWRYVPRINVYITKKYPVYLVHKVDEKKSVLRSLLSYDEVREAACDQIRKKCFSMKDTGLSKEEIEAKFRDLNSEMDEKFRMFFKLKVVDAMYDEEKVYSSSRETIITIMDTNLDMYESLQEGDKVVFYKLYMDTYGKVKKDGGEHLAKHQLTLSYKQKKSQFDGLRQWGLQSASDKKIGLMRVETTMDFNRLVDKLSKTFGKTKEVSEEERKMIIKAEARVCEAAVVGLILKISAGETEFTRGLKWIKKVYLLCPTHHLLILNVSQPFMKYRFGIQTSTSKILFLQRIALFYWIRFCSMNWQFWIWKKSIFLLSLCCKLRNG
jgi:hypothetical protein